MSFFSSNPFHKCLVYSSFSSPKSYYIQPFPTPHTETDSTTIIHSPLSYYTTCIIYMQSFHVGMQTRRSHLNHMVERMPSTSKRHVCVREGEKRGEGEKKETGNQQAEVMANMKMKLQDSIILTCLKSSILRKKSLNLMKVINQYNVQLMFFFHGYILSSHEKKNSIIWTQNKLLYIRLAILKGECQLLPLILTENPSTTDGKLS